MENKLQGKVSQGERKGPMALQNDCILFKNSQRWPNKQTDMIFIGKGQGAISWREVQGKVSQGVPVLNEHPLQGFKEAKSVHEVSSDHFVQDALDLYEQSIISQLFLACGASVNLVVMFCVWGRRPRKILGF